MGGLMLTFRGGKPIQGEKTSPLHASIWLEVISTADPRCSYVRFAKSLLEVYILGLYAVCLASTATRALQPLQDAVVSMTIRTGVQPPSSSDVEAQS